MNLASNWNIDICKVKCPSFWRVVEGVVASFWITAALNSARCGMPAWKERVLEYSGVPCVLLSSFIFPFWIVVLFFMDMTYQCLKEEGIQVDYLIDLHWLYLRATVYLNEPCKVFVRVREYWTDGILRVLYRFFVLASKRILWLEPFVIWLEKQLSYLD